MSFTNLGLMPQLIETLTNKGYKNATAIQTSVIPIALRGRDILGAAQTGTGKTAAFALPIIQQLAKNPQNKQNSPRALIVVPTRELASQLSKNIKEYATGLELSCLALFGGANISLQTKELENGADIIVGTPGRLLELNKQGHLRLWKIEYLVFDEADTIFDMGFIREVEQLLELIPVKRQNMLFSATMTGAVKQLSERILNKPMLLEIDNLKAADATLQQIVHPVEKEKKLELLSYLIGKNNYPGVLVFVRTKKEADEVSEELTKSGLKNGTIHGDKTHGARDKALLEFREGKSRILVATDIAARGLDIDGLNVVINYDIPHISTDYLHRIGRTGRAGNEGVAITLLTSAEYTSWKKIESMLGKKIRIEIVEGFEPENIQKPSRIRGRSITKDEKKSSEKKSKTAGAFGNKKTKAPPKPKFATKRDSKATNSKSFGNTKPSVTRSGGRGR